MHAGGGEYAVAQFNRVHQHGRARHKAGSPPLSRSTARGITGERAADSLTHSTALGRAPRLKLLKLLPTRSDTWRSSLAAASSPAESTAKVSNAAPALIIPPPWITVCAWLFVCDYICDHLGVELLRITVNTEVRGLPDVGESPARQRPASERSAAHGITLARSFAGL
jgi:hypothetical protein